MQPEIGNQITPRSGSRDESASKQTGAGFNSQHYASAKVRSNSNGLNEKELGAGGNS